MITLDYSTAHTLAEAVVAEAGAEHADPHRVCLRGRRGAALPGRVRPGPRRDGP
jgi:hypothetical protein